ncbi:MAG: DUF309 domain-containing protein [Candidatus Omnitrophica bacterium]|nr:DUF309 domain-containing protein [Candidatus Omnitrophota bacterium]
MKQNLDSRYQEFIRLFNTKQYWHAHEVLEQLWLADRQSADRAFYKGLIQLAAVLYHVEKGNFTGAWALFNSANRYLSQYPEQHLGIWRGKLLHTIREFAEICQKEGLGTAVARPIINA